jgi:tripartite-type tricarboxylate transporter receptor subunit TctC
MAQCGAVTARVGLDAVQRPRAARYGYEPKEKGMIFLRMLLRLILIAATAACLATSAAAFAQAAFPSKPIRIVVPFPPGGPTDIFARNYGNALSKVLGQPVLIDNRAGAGGAIGTLEVKRSAPDGYTLLFATASSLALYNIMAVKPQYDYLKDFNTIAVVGGSAVIIMANKSAPQTLKALVDMARAQPGQLRYGSPGQGTYLHLSMERFLYETGIKIEHIPYKGSGQVKPALLGGQVDFMIEALSSGLSLHQGGQAKILAIASARRSALAPDVPTVDEALGIKGFEAILWNGVAVPAGTPKAVVDALAAATEKVLKDPTVQEQLSRLAMESMDTTPASATEFIKAEMVKWRPVVEATGLKIE